jgi:hypothetical protein
VVVCNAWSVYDTSTEPANQPNFRYSDNPAHDFNLTVAEADALRFDQVFAAGNCGQFCPDSRCGPNDIGPGRGILGANSHVAVLTVGAVRADGLWLGYSSQGPGQPDLGTNKPDLVAPSQFEEVRDSNSLNSGTSTSCGLAAGGVAALRTVTGPVGLPPAALRGRLRNTARQRGADDIWRSGVQWNMRLGHGVMDLADILNQI